MLRCGSLIQKIRQIATDLAPLIENFVQNV